jgi:hypothetical protein
MTLKKSLSAAPVTILVFPLLTQINILLNYLSIAGTEKSLMERDEAVGGCRITGGIPGSRAAVAPLYRAWAAGWL